MSIESVVNSDQLDFEGIPSSYYLLGLLSAFENRFQAMADSTMQEISWKQFFAIICINMCREAPTLKELSEIVGSSHQNVKTAKSGRTACYRHFLRLIKRVLTLRLMLKVRQTASR